MVIECISCSKKFNLNETLLKTAGSRVRCSKCGTIFHAYPAHNASSMNPILETDGITKDADQGESATSGFEKRKHARVPVSIPVLCDALDLEGKPCDIHVGAIKEVSQTGLAIELFTTPISEQVSLSFVDVENRDVQIKAKVVHSRIKSFMTWIGLSLTGPPMEIDYFVTQVMQTHQTSRSADRQVQI
jgi:predicted Zn finger-like uncharacterized protein